MKRFLSLLAAVGLLLTLPACDSFVEEVENPIDTIDDDQLNDESQISFVITGVQSNFSTVYDRITVHAGGLSDELIFDTRVPNATFPTYAELDTGEIEFANNSNDGVYNDLGELRFFSDDLLRRVDEITFEDADLKTEAQFIGNFYGGVARYFYATYFGLTQRQGGGVITTDPDNPAPFTPANEMYDLALEKLNTALQFADDYEKRVTNTLIARIHLFEGNFSAARAAAQNGMQEGDAPFASLHSSENTNEWWTQAGRGRNQWVVDFSYQELVTAEPEEAARIKVEPVTGTDGTIFYRQAVYLDRPDPLPFLTWQNNALILAELDLRDDNAGSALPRINAVRASHAISPLGAATLDVLIEERRRELFTLGLRLVDQRRFDLWHLGPDTWQYFPITQNERNGNENL